MICHERPATSCEKCVPTMVPHSVMMSQVDAAVSAVRREEAKLRAEMLEALKEAQIAIQMAVPGSKMQDHLASIIAKAERWAQS